MLGFDVRPVPLVEHVSSSQLRHLLRAGEVERAAALFGRPPELDGTVVSGTLAAAPSAFRPRISRSIRELLVPAYGIYAGAVGDNRAAISIGTNPHYGGEERRIEAFVLDFEGDLYGRRLVVELWKRLRDERVFDSEQDLIDQIARDVEETRAAKRPS